MSFNDYNDDLQQIGIYFGTDKYDHNHSFAGKSYLHIYNNYFKHLRTNPVNFLEIGVKDGQSHRMWSKYFHSNSKIYGLDIDPRCSNNTSNNIKIFRDTNNLDAVKNSLQILIRGLEQKRYSPQEILNIVKRADRNIDDAIELVDKENEEINR